MKKNYNPINSTIYFAILLLTVLISNSVNAKNILIYGPMLAGTPNEQTLAVAAGHSVTVVDASQWSAMSTGQFASFDAIIIPDDGCNSTAANAAFSTLDANKSTWSSAITGKRFYYAYDGLYHRQGDYQKLITNGINFVANSGGTGLYVSFSCTFHNSGTVSVSFLSLVDNISIQGGGRNAVNILEPTHSTMTGITNSGLSNWGNSSHAIFTSWPNTILNIANADGLASILASKDCTPGNVSSISISSNSETNTGGINTNLYIGYPTNNPTVTLTADATGAVTWSPATYLSCTTCTTAVFSPTVEGNYTLTAANCGGSSKSVTFCVKDIRVPNTSGTKAAVWMCHKEPTTNTTKTEAVLLRGIPAHFSNHKGDKLGGCGNTCATSKRDFDYENVVVDENNLEVMCTPNPFRQSFKLHYISNSELEATISIYGMTGNLIENRTLASVADEIELGQNLTNGIYTVSFTQGNKNRVFRMIKVD